MERYQDSFLRLLALETDTARGAQGCGSRVDELAAIVDSELMATPLPTELRAARDHLQTCDDCREEYGLLLDSLREIQLLLEYSNQPNASLAELTRWLTLHIVD